MPKFLMLPVVPTMLAIFAYLGVQPPAPVTPTAAAHTIVETLRIWGGLIGMAGFAIGTIIYLWYMAKVKTSQAQSDSVAIFKTELEARKLEVERLRTDMIAKDSELMTLRSRTDITELMRLQQEMLKECRTHDATVATTLNNAIEKGNEQYKSVMASSEKTTEMLKKTLDYLAEQSRVGNGQAKMNMEQIVSMAGSLNRIADKLLVVERKVENVQDKVNDVQDFMTEAPGPDTPRRRKNDPRH